MNFKTSLYKKVTWFQQSSKHTNTGKRSIVLDLSATNNLDQAAIEMLDQLQIEANKRDIQIVIAAVNSYLWHKFVLYDQKTQKQSCTFQIFVTIEQAVANLTTV